ncbi:MAG TPA: hypothetical protein VIW29_12785 [Polyangiaceae bacterium]
MLQVAVCAGAEPEAPVVEVAVDSHVGQSTAPYFTSAFPSTSGYGASFVLATRLRIARSLQLGLRVPLVLMRVEQPAGALYAEAAWGNPELNASFEQPWLEHDGWSVGLGVSLALGVPLAEHDPAQLAGRALRLANALEGFSEPGLFTPGVLPLTPAGGLVLESPRWKFSASLALPLLFRVSNADLPPESEPQPFGFTPVLALEAQLRVLRWLSVAGSSRFTAQAVEPANDPAGAVQVLVAGRVDFHLGEHVLLSPLVQAPVGGSLGGSTVTGGLGLRVAF